MKPLDILDKAQISHIQVEGVYTRKSTDHSLGSISSSVYCLHGDATCYLYLDAHAGVLCRPSPFIQLWKNVHEGSEKKLLTVSAIIAQAESENIGNLLEILDKDTERFREIMLSWLKMIEKRRKKNVRQERFSRRHIRSLPKIL
jgi:hypothetical protein